MIDVMCVWGRGEGVIQESSRKRLKKRRGVKAEIVRREGGDLDHSFKIATYYSRTPGKITLFLLDSGNMHLFMGDSCRWNTKSLTIFV